MPVAERVQTAKRLDALVEHAAAALLLDVLGGVAREARDDLDVVHREEIGEILHSRLEEHRQVTAVDHVTAELLRFDHQAPEVRVQLRRAAGQVDGRDARTRTEQVEDAGRDGLAHDLGPRRTGLDVAVVARLIAALADVPGTPERAEPVAYERGVEVAYLPFSDQS